MEAAGLMNHFPCLVIRGIYEPLNYDGITPTDSRLRGLLESCPAESGLRPAVTGHGALYWGLQGLVTSDARPQGGPTNSPVQVPSSSKGPYRCILANLWLAFTTINRRPRQTRPWRGMLEALLLHRFFPSYAVLPCTAGGLVNGRDIAGLRRRLRENCVGSEGSSHRTSAQDAVFEKLKEYAAVVFDDFLEHFSMATLTQAFIISEQEVIVFLLKVRAECRANSSYYITLCNKIDMGLLNVLADASGS
ncbi:hypothetical protein B0J13DRAFT_608013 [Dactylonectria estremocensis]|uniref:Uncharacterized protein n=1 Tax=Dactylonectria estremocensis TaxID=1079267 RepID=A0A9P9EQE5_9HYPO|nr:hypothetical protein B0J13DRAFT_608013 [Dactylonectria estremocensis]